MIANLNLNLYKIKMFFLVSAFVISGGGLAIVNFSNTNAAVKNQATVNNWWPTDNAIITGTQPFQAVIDGWGIDKYDMFWSVDGGAPQAMVNSYLGYPHKRADVNVTPWNWQTSNIYRVTYTAKSRSGAEIAAKSFNITIPHETAAVIPALSTGTSTPVVSESLAAPSATTSTVATMPATTSSSSVNLFVDPNSQAKQAANSLRASRPADAALIDKIANSPTAKWFGGWNGNMQTDVNAYVSAAQGATPVLVAYNIPQRDCGSYSAGGANSGDDYLAWIRGMAAGIGSRNAWVILEPDAIPGMDCLTTTDQATRLALLSQAVSILSQSNSTRIYIDAGNPGWHPAGVIADRLKAANIAAADGFSLNVSNFIATADNVTFGQTLSAALSGKPFVVDTSRNGLGAAPANAWCNPDGRALGNQPTSDTGNKLVDAFLWIKTPGESDGACNGGPSAGTWWTEYALGLVRRTQF